MQDTLLSPYWYRIAKLHPRLRGHVTVRMQRTLDFMLSRVASRPIAKLDPDAASRRKEARKTRDVWFRTADDGMATLTIYGPVEQVHAAFDRITTDEPIERPAGGTSAPAETIIFIACSGVMSR